MAEKEIRLPKWDGKEYYPATTTEAVADRERQKGLNEVLSDIEHTIDSYNRANQIMLNQKQNKLNNYKEDPSNGSVDIYAQGTVSMRNDSQGGVSTIEVYNEDNTEGVIPVARMSSEKENGDYAYVEARGNEVNIVGDYVNVNGFDLMQAIEDVATLNGTGEGSVSKTVTDEIAKVIANAPADFDTLKEIADYIDSDQTNAAEINNTLDRHTSEITSLQNNKQDALANYVEEPRGKTTIKYPNGKARVEVSNARAALWANDNKVAIAADRNGTSMLYQKTAEDGSIEHRDEISIGRHDDSTATHITLTSKSTTEEAGEKLTSTSTIQVNPERISMSSPNGEIGDVVKEISGKASSESVSKLRQEVEEKAPKVGYAPELKVNFAKELVGRGESTPEVIGAIRPTGVRSIGDGNATITKVRGNSMVWNQLIDGAITFTRMSTQDNITYVPTMTTGSGNLYYTLGVAKGSHKYLCTGRIVNSFGTEPTAGKLPLGTIFTYEYGKNINLVPFGPNVTASTDDWVRIEEPIQFHDLTLMFGSGKEPKTIEEFEARKPLGVTNEYNEGTIVSFDGDALKSVGFNAYNGAYAKVIGGEEYHATGTTSVSFAKELGADTTAITLDSEGKFIPEEDGYVFAEGKDIVIHLTHSYTPEHVDEYEEDVHVLPNVKSILDANGNQLFPYGLLSAGGVHDEITATKAIKRISHHTFNGTENWSIQSINDAGVVNYQITSSYTITTTESMCNRLKKQSTLIADTQDEGYFYNPRGIFIRLFQTTASTIKEFKTWLSNNPVEINIALITPIEVDLPEPLNMTYEAWDFGTEELIHEGATTPLNADIVYQFNAVDRIRENSSAIEDLEGHVEERKEDGIELLTNGNLKLTLKGETREFMPATPSGDPMHWAYVSAGAEYNATGNFIVKDAPWKGLVDPIDYKAQWNLDIVADNLVQNDSITYNGVSYHYAKDTRTSPTDGTQPRYRIVVKDSATGKWVWDDTKVLHLPNHWYLNGLGDITNGEMREIYRIEKKDMSSGVYMLYWRQKTLRTATVRQGSYGVQGAGHSVSQNTAIEVVNFDTLAIFDNEVVESSNIRHIISNTNRLTLEYIAKTISKGTFSTANLVTCDLRRLKKSISMANSPNLSRATTIQLISKAIPTTAITITLHPDAYARLAEDADIVAALEAQPLVTLVSA